MSRYDVNSANSNRQVTFLVEATVADAFVSIKGSANSYPYYDQIVGVPTAAQETAQLRMSLIARGLSAYAVLVGVAVVDGTAANSAIELTYETDESGVFFNNMWPTDTTLPKHQTGVVNAPPPPADLITDTVGVGGMPYGPKSKPGLQGLADEVLLVNYGVAGEELFGATPILPDGTAGAGAAIAALAVTLA